MNKSSDIPDDFSVDSPPDCNVTLSDFTDSEGLEHEKRHLQAEKLANMSTPDPKSDYKVERKFAKYGMEDEYLEAPKRWLGVGDREETSLRELEVWVNVEILRRAMGNPSEYLEDELKNMYHILKSDDAESDEKIAVKKRISKAGADVDEINQDFVSYGSLYRYFRDELELEPPESSKKEHSPTNTKRRLDRLSSRAESVLSSELENTSCPTNDEHTNLVPVIQFSVFCPDCNEKHTISDIFPSEEDS